MTTVDVRPIPGNQKHPTIFGAFHNLTAGEAFELVNDHDPEQGPAVWRVRIGKPKA
jgi:uncharacterized protein (DUF2249 family)